MATSLSIIIPHFRDETALAGLMEQLALPRRRHGIEVIVVDGGNSSVCQGLCETHSAKYMNLEPNRGKQLLAGAHAATSKTLWFLHADAIVPPDAIEQILTARDNGIEAGYFRFSFSGPDLWFKKALAFSVNLRNWLGGVPYGDQGIFVRRSLYFVACGHAAIPLFEEVSLVSALRRSCRFVQLPFTLPVNPRRWERDGYLKRTILNRFCALAFMVRIPSEQINRWYSRRAWLRQGN